MQPNGTKLVVVVEVVGSEDGGLIPDFDWEGGQTAPVDAKNHTCHISVRRTTPRGEEILQGVTCTDSSGESTMFPDGTLINQMVAAPDGTLWVVGDNGGLYRITLE